MAQVSSYTLQGGGGSSVAQVAPADTPEHVVFFAMTVGFVITTAIPMLGIIFSYLLAGAEAFLFVAALSLVLTPLCLAICAYLFAAKYPSTKPLTWTTVLTLFPMVLGLFLLDGPSVLLLLPFCVFPFAGAAAGRDLGSKP